MTTPPLHHADSNEPETPAGRQTETERTKTAMEETIHLLEARHAHREGALEAQLARLEGREFTVKGCDAPGTARVVTEASATEVTCPKCNEWYGSQRLVLTEQGHATLAAAARPLKEGHRERWQDGN